MQVSHERIAAFLDRVDDAQDLSYDARLRSLDSLALVELLVVVEAEFDIVIPDEDLEDSTFASLTDFAEVVENLVRMQHAT